MLFDQKYVCAVIPTFETALSRKHPRLQNPSAGEVLFSVLSELLGGFTGFTLLLSQQMSPTSPPCFSCCSGVAGEAARSAVSMGVGDFSILIISC